MGDSRIALECVEQESVMLVEEARHARVDVEWRAGDWADWQRADAECDLGDGGVVVRLGRARQHLELADHAALPVVGQRVRLLEGAVAPGGRRGRLHAHDAARPVLRHHPLPVGLRHAKDGRLEVAEPLLAQHALHRNPVVRAVRAKPVAGALEHGEAELGRLEGAVVPVLHRRVARARRAQEAEPGRRRVAARLDLVEEAGIRANLAAAREGARPDELLARKRPRRRRRRLQDGDGPQRACSRAPILALARHHRCVDGARRVCLCAGAPLAARRHLVRARAATGLDRGV
mmetsp:Transcript_45362/g.145984  ORF Transcript_45362/g.145984 Transcript_45362/m.145984 type:complete len:290 (+) Transcript_45362:724-1593(+)